MKTDLAPSANTVSATETSGLKRVVFDLFTLGELQVKMLKLDATKSAKLVWASTIFFALSLSLGVAGVIMLAIAASHGLIATLNWQPESAYGVVGLASVGLAFATISLCYTLARAACSVFRNSTDEFTKNFEAIKNSIGSS